MPYRSATAVVSANSFMHGDLGVPLAPAELPREDVERDTPCLT